MGCMIYFGVFLLNSFLRFNVSAYNVAVMDYFSIFVFEIPQIIFNM